MVSRICIAHIKKITDYALSGDLCVENWFALIQTGLLYGGEPHAGSGDQKKGLFHL